jgi:hypothetical protein
MTRLRPRRKFSRAPGTARTAAWVEDAIDAVLRCNSEHALLSSVTALDVDSESGAQPQPVHGMKTSTVTFCPARWRSRIPFQGHDHGHGVHARKRRNAHHSGQSPVATRSLPGPDDDVISLEPEKGECAVWLGSTYHGAGVNLTKQARLGVSVASCLGWCAQSKISTSCSTLKQSRNCLSPSNDSYDMTPLRRRVCMTGPPRSKPHSRESVSSRASA